MKVKNETADVDCALDDAALDAVRGGDALDEEIMDGINWLGDTVQQELITVAEWIEDYAEGAKHD